jgi:ribose 5-phosphate isomerase A
MAGQDVESQKAAAAAAAVERVQDGMTVGLGTGSTAAHAVRGLGARVRAGLRVRGIPTSRATEALAKEQGIPLIGFDETTRLDLTIDGADEVDEDLVLIKGGGGALLREKIVAAASSEVVILVDAGKVKERLGEFPLPVEVVVFGWQAAAERIQSLGCKPVLRQGKDGRPFVTDEGHHILDCPLGWIDAPSELGRRLKEIPGVVEHGLFINLATTVLVGRPGGVDVLTRSRPARG